MRELPVQIPALRVPRQRRSAETLSSILAATIRLLEEKTFEEISVREIAEAAGVSVGTIYTRFRDKNALLNYLILELLRKQTKTFRILFDPAPWRGTPLDQRLLHFSRLLVTSAQMQPGVQRAIALRQMLRQGALTSDEKSLCDESRAILERWLLDCRDEIRNPQTTRAIRFALSMGSWGVQNLVLFGGDPTELSGDELAEEITRIMLAYLKCDLPLPREAPPLAWPGASFTEFPGLTSGP